MLNFDPPPAALVAQTPAQHRLFQLQAEWRMFPASRKLIEIDIAWHPEWGIAVRGGELVAVAPRPPIPQPPSTARRTATPYAQAEP